MHNGGYLNFPSVLQDSDCQRDENLGIASYWRLRWGESIVMATVMTLDEVAQFLKVHPSTVYRLLKQHSIPAFKLGSDWRFNQESIERWMETKEADRSAETDVISSPTKETIPKRAPSPERRPKF